MRAAGQKVIASANEVQREAFMLTRIYDRVPVAARDLSNVH